MDLKQYQEQKKNDLEYGKRENNYLLLLIMKEKLTKKAKDSLIEELNKMREVAIKDDDYIKSAFPHLVYEISSILESVVWIEIEYKDTEFWVKTAPDNIEYHLEQLWFYIGNTDWEFSEKWWNRVVSEIEESMNGCEPNNLREYIKSYIDNNYPHNI